MVSLKKGAIMKIFQSLSIEKIVSGISHVDTIGRALSRVLGSVSGSGASSDQKEDAQEKTGGFFSFVDEQIYNILLRKMEETDPGSMALLVGFYDFLFPKGGFFNTISRFLGGNRYRKFIVTLPVSKKTKAVSETRETSKGRRGDAGYQRTVAKEDHEVVETNDERIKFLEWMVSIIRSNGSPKNGYQKGYEKLLAVFQSGHIPAGTSLPFTGEKISDHLQKWKPLFVDRWNQMQVLSGMGAGHISNATEPEKIDALTVKVREFGQEADPWKKAWFRRVCWALVIIIILLFLII